MAEISKFRRQVLNLITAFSGRSRFDLDIIDIGSGDDPLDDDVETFDLPQPYTVRCNVAALTYKGDAREIDQIVTKKYDVVFSSHLLEDFARNETIPVLNTWVSLLKDRGLLVLLLPDQQRYEAHCKRNGEKPNEHHQIPEFSSDYLMECFKQIPDMKVMYIENFVANGEYNFMVIAKRS